MNVDHSSGKEKSVDGREVLSQSPPSSDESRQSPLLRDSDSRFSESFIKIYTGAPASSKVSQNPNNSETLRQITTKATGRLPLDVECGNPTRILTVGVLGLDSSSAQRSRRQDYARSVPAIRTATTISVGVD
jgi:hypothetical protein